MLSKQVGVRPVQRGESEEDGEHQRPRPGRTGDHQVAGESDGGVDEADHQDPPGEPERGADPHPAPQHAHRGEREQRADQRRGEGARERGEPLHFGGAERVLDDPGDRERAGDLEEEGAGVVEDASRDAAGQQCPDPGDEVCREHDLERRHEEPDDQGYFGERDGPRDAAAHVDVDAELFGEQERDRQHRPDPPQVAVGFEGQPQRDRGRREEADRDHGDRVDAEAEFVGATGARGGPRWPCLACATPRTWHVDRDGNVRPAT